MYAYCSNEPIANYDPAGNYYAKVEDRITTGCGGRGGIPAFVVRPSKPDPEAQPKQNKVGLIDFITNTDEQVVLDAEHFAMYRGVPVIRINGNRSGFFGVIFLTYETNGRSNPEDMVRHEYGHAQQLKELGLATYLTNIFIPSWLEWGSNSDYYSREVEITADILGGVVSRVHSPDDVDTGFKYLESSDWLGVIAWTTIK